MFIEFIDQFRCTSVHEESWLVATFLERNDRFLVRGTLGCHICLRQFPVERGIAYFGAVPGRDSDNQAQDTTTQTILEGDPETAMRAAAFLNASERATVVLAGTWARQAHELTRILPVRVFAMNAGGVVQEAESIAVFESSEGIPLAGNSVDGIALDQETATPAAIVSALKVLRPGVRLLGPVSMPAPPQVTVLASDTDFWIGEKVSEMVPLRRA